MSTSTKPRVSILGHVGAASLIAALIASGSAAEQIGDEVRPSKPEQPRIEPASIGGRESRRRRRQMERDAAKRAAKPKEPRP